MEFNLTNIEQFRYMTRGEIKPSEKLGPGGFDPASMFMKRKNDETHSTTNPIVDTSFEYNQDDLKELEEYCKSHNIVGVNFGNRSPRQILNMLKGKQIPQNENMKKQKILLNG